MDLGRHGQCFFIRFLIGIVVGRVEMQIGWLCGRVELFGP